MSWNPALKVANKRQIAANLLNFVKANQEDALAWAKTQAGLSETVKKFITFDDALGDRDSPNVPSLAISDDDDASDYTADMTNAAYRLTFLARIQNADFNKVVRQARVYSLCLESLIRNIPTATLLADTHIDNYTLETIETGFPRVKSNENQTLFQQEIEIRAVFTLRASSYS